MADSVAAYNSVLPYRVSAYEANMKYHDVQCSTSQIVYCIGTRPGKYDPSNVVIIIGFNN